MHSQPCRESTHSKTHCGDLPGVIRLALLLLAAAGVAQAERRPVLDQVGVPHDYYYREMYLPQLTTGPAALSWSADGDSLIYAMQGSLWVQHTNSYIAVQLTASGAYDHQPDVSPDGRRVVFARYDGASVELMLLDLATGDVSPLTTNRAVNVDPRWSPDGTRLAYVSTAADGRFRTFTGRVDGETLTGRPLAAQRESAVARYYYSSYDHQLSPVWTKDGDKLLVIANPETPYGTGSLWLHDEDGDTPPMLVHREETSWKSRPDIAPDGKRYVFASYLGRQWHQLWSGRLDGAAEPFPLTYGDYDVWAPRWSPDGERIAFIVNEFGNTSIRIQEFVGGQAVDLAIGERRYLAPHGTLKLDIHDHKGASVAARVSIVASDGRVYAPPDRWLHADDGFDRDHSRTERHYFHAAGPSVVELPQGPATVTVWRGPEFLIGEYDVNIEPGTENKLRVTPGMLDLPAGFAADWQSADVHVHMNYGGAYRNTPANLIAQAEAEDLDLVFNLIVNKEQRIPDIAYFDTRPDRASTATTVLSHAQEFHTSHWGHMGLLGLQSHLLIPDYSAYPETAAASLYPDNATIAALAREQGAVVGYVHPYLSPAPDPATDKALTHAFPADAALGLVDFYEVVGFADHRASADVWYRLMNCGIRVAAAGGTDAMANYASLRGPLGVNRTYANVSGRLTDASERQQVWLDTLRAGHTFATNSPLLGLDVEGRRPGDELLLEKGLNTLKYRGFMRSAVPVDHVEVVLNGDVVGTFGDEIAVTGADVEGEVTVDRSGWLLLRAWSEQSHPLVFDLYPYATTTPVWLTVGGEPPRSVDDARYFLEWTKRLAESARDHDGYNNATERERILAHFATARRRFEACRP